MSLCKPYYSFQFHEVNYKLFEKIIFKKDMLKKKYRKQHFLSHKIKTGKRNQLKKLCVRVG